jgi:magnesium transporter
MLFVMQRAASGGVVACTDPEAALARGEAVWVDLLNPTPAEEALVEAALGADVPTAEERGALEDSARFWDQPDELGLTATLLVQGPRKTPVARRRRKPAPPAADTTHDRAPVSFILRRVGDKPAVLVTVRTTEPKAFQRGPGRTSLRIEAQDQAPGILLALLEAIIERLADQVEKLTVDVNKLSGVVFARNFTDRRLDVAVRDLGGLGAHASHLGEALLSLERLVAFTETARPDHGLDVVRLRGLRRDLAALKSYVDGLQSNLVFVLDASLGLVASRQTRSIRALAVAGTIFLPPTLIASIYGMNFEHMPELGLSWGYPAALGLMALSTATMVGLAKWLRWW